jgi:hypothetical protein
MKYFDIQTPMKKQSAWEKSLLELNHMLNGTCKNNNTYTKGTQKKIGRRREKEQMHLTSTHNQ